MSFIEIKNLKFEYGGNGFAINGFSLSVERNSVTALAGPNGAGKTTLMKIIAGILENYGGSVAVNGADLKKMGADSRGRLISYVPQVDSYLFDYPVFDMVAMGRRPYTGSFGTLSAADTRVVEEQLRDSGLWEKRNKNFSKLSGGEKRMALIARALAQEAPLLLLDEPTTYLDLKHTVDFMKKIEELKKKGKTVIFISHSLNLASEAADRVVVMKNGALAKDGPPAEVITAPVLESIYGTGCIEITAGDTGKPKVYPKI